MNSPMPTIDFTVTSNGITIFSDKYLKTPRFVPFDLAGKCQLCKSDAVDLDYVIQPYGCIFYCNRLKRERFVPFDISAKMEEGCTFFRVKTRGRSMNIPYESLKAISTLSDEKIEVKLPVANMEDEEVKTKNFDEMETTEDKKRAKMLQDSNELPIIFEKNEHEHQFPSIDTVVIDDASTAQKAIESIMPEKQMEIDKSSSTNNGSTADIPLQEKEVDILKNGKIEKNVEDAQTQTEQIVA